MQQHTGTHAARSANDRVGMHGGEAWEGSGLQPDGVRTARPASTARRGRCSGALDDEDAEHAQGTRLGARCWARAGDVDDTCRTAEVMLRIIGDVNRAVWESVSFAPYCTYPQPHQVLA